jgi:hypothetical protein
MPESLAGCHMYMSTSYLGMLKPVTMDFWISWAVQPVHPGFNTCVGCAEVPYPEDSSSGVFSYAFTTCAENVGPLGPWQEECSSYYEYQGESALSDIASCLHSKKNSEREREFSY